MTTESAERVATMVTIVETHSHIREASDALVQASTELMALGKQLLDEAHGDRQAPAGPQKPIP